MWTDADRELLTRLWNVEKLTAGQIAERMPGKTRSSVIGQAHRLKLDKRASPIRPAVVGAEPRPKRKRTSFAAVNANRKKERKPPTPPKAVVRPVIPPDQYAAWPRRPLTAKTCQFIEVEKKRGYTDADKCGKTAESSAYCLAHEVRCTNPRQTDASRLKAVLPE